MTMVTGESSVAPTSSTLHAVGYTAAIKACQKSGDNWRCLAMLDEMKRQHPSLPLDTATVNSVVTAAAKLGEPGKALNLLSEFAYACDVVTYNCALDACVKGGEPLKAVEVFLRLQSRSILAETQDTGGGAAIDASSLEVRETPKHSSANSLKRESRPRTAKANVLPCTSIFQHRCLPPKRWRFPQSLPSTSLL